MAFVFLQRILIFLFRRRQSGLGTFWLLIASKGDAGQKRQKGQSGRAGMRAKRQSLALEKRGEAGMTAPGEGPFRLVWPKNTGKIIAYSPLFRT
jgi:hypothetical protein